ncbi:MAG: glycosyltransferase [Alphaproteobacteria bacterium]|jgi:hypothetical protein
MRAVFVNHCHPDTPHVCAVRVREFATTLANQGHRILLLTETLDADDTGVRQEELAERLETYDWSEPFRLACPPAGGKVLRRQRSNGLPRLASKAIVAGSYFATGSVFGDWGRGVRRYLPELIEAFEPEIVWASFGNTECYRIARWISKRAGCNWVADVKDYWGSFIPPGLRGHLARRLLGGAAAMTALSRGHIDDIVPFAPRRLTEAATVVYSGVADSLLSNACEPGPDPGRVTLTGAIYSLRDLTRLIEGFALAGRPLTIDYAGHQGAEVKNCATAFQGQIEVVDHGYLPLDRLHALQCNAVANAFVRSGPGWFQHKLPELLTARRPIICLPDAEPESEKMAVDLGVPFHSCKSPADVARALEGADAAPVAPVDSRTLVSLTWTSRAEALISVLIANCR